MKYELIKKIEREKIVAILRGLEKEQLLPTADALFKGGIRLVEVTYRADGSADEKTARAIETLTNAFGEEMEIGAGTVLTERQAELCAEAGGRFVISPDVNERVIKKTLMLSMVSIAGAMTPTEIAAASSMGADFVKLFPAGCLGAGYVKAIKAPLSYIKLLAVGGIHEKNMAEFFEAGVCGFGIGTNIADKTLIDRGDFKGIEALAKKYVAAASALGE